MFFGKIFGLFLVAGVVAGSLPKIGLVSNCIEGARGVCTVDFDVSEDGLVSPQYMVDGYGRVRVPLDEVKLHVVTQWNSSMVFQYNHTDVGCEYYTYRGADALVNITMFRDSEIIEEVGMWTELTSFVGWTEQDKSWFQALIRCPSQEGWSVTFQGGFADDLMLVRATDMIFVSGYAYAPIPLKSKWVTTDIMFGRRSLKCEISTTLCKGKVFTLGCSAYWDGPSCAQVQLAAYRGGAHQYVPIVLDDCSGFFSLSYVLDLAGLDSVSVNLVDGEYVQLMVPSCVSNASVPGDILMWTSSDVSVMEPQASAQEVSNWWLWVTISIGGLVLVGVLVLVLLLTVPKCKKGKSFSRLTLSDDF